MAASLSPETAAPDHNDSASYHVDFTPNPALYPFESQWFESSVGRIHYLDEGERRPLLLMHGNPDWSFLYREMIPLLSEHFRCIAIDYPGFGLSVHPAGYSYLPSAQAEVVAELVEYLDLEDAVLVGQHRRVQVLQIRQRDPARVVQEGVSDVATRNTTLRVVRRSDIGRLV